MRTHTRILAGTVVIAAAGWIAGCNSTIDDEPNVVLEVKTLTIAPITGTTDPGGNCNLTITNATATFDNKPKNALAVASPFNDIVLRDVLVGYTWDDAVGVAAAQFGVGGTVPANGSTPAQFAVVNLQDLAGRDGHTASLTLTFRGVTVSGEPVSTTTGGSLSVAGCLAPPPPNGACCVGTGPGVCSSLTQTDCAANGGTYVGDNTTCLPTTCP